MSVANSIRTSDDLNEAGARGASNEAAREPSMEEILASIRRIIAQDQSLFASEAATGANVEEARASEPEAPDCEPRPEVEAETSAIHPGAIGARVETAYPPTAEPDLTGAEEPLVSSATSASVATAFNTLVASRFAQDPDAIRAMTRDALQPLLASWLDANLPTLVERLVVAEIERIAKGV
jgi:uncharacterized protein